MLSVLVVTAMYPSAARPGYGAFVKHQVDALRAKGCMVDVIDFPGYRSKYEYLKAARRVYVQTRRKRYSIVHAHYGVTFVACLARNATPLVMTLHGSDVLQSRIERQISRMASKVACATIVASPEMARHVRGVVIPCGVDLSLFSPIPRERAREKLGLRQERKYVLFPFNPQRRVKRFDLASAAVQMLVDEGQDLEILTVSDVHFTEMPWYYSAADAMILCSESEGSPTSVKEALACNLPVVSTEVGDVREIFCSMAGLEIAGPSLEALGAALRRVLFPDAPRTCEFRDSMRRYSQEATAERILDVYRRVIGAA